MTALEVIESAGITGATVGQIAAALRWDEARAAAVVAELLRDGRVCPVAEPPAYLATDVADALRTQVVERLQQRQHERPWVMGVTSLGLARALGAAERDVIRLLAAPTQSGTIVYRGGYYATADFAPRLAADQRAFFENALAAHAEASALPLTYEALRLLMKHSAVADLGPALDTLIACGELSKVGESVYRGSQIAALRAKLEAALRARGQLTVAEFRTVAGTSRKYAVPLLEFFDAIGVTRRSGAVRVLSRGPSGPAD